MPYAIEDQARTGVVNDYPGVALLKVNGTPDEKTWNQIVKEYHYLGYTRTIGRRVKYLIIQSDKVIGAISFNQASLHLQVRDNHIGWTASQREQYLKHVVNNNRLLILPWIKIKNLASHVLSKAAKAMRADWKAQYSEEIYAVETFVDSEKHKGTCYIASGWAYLGETSGFGKKGKELVYHGVKKKVFFRVLNHRFPKNIQPARIPKPDSMGVLGMQLQGMSYDPEILEKAGLTAESAGEITNKLILFLGQFTIYLNSVRLCAKLAVFIRGIFSPLERKSLEPIALGFMEGETAPRLLQHFFSDAKWDEEGMGGRYRDLLLEGVSEPDGMITVDECGEPKKGRESVGVARQYCGPMGKTENCQTSVMTGYSGGEGYGLLQARLYIPEKWFENEYRNRYKKCKIPSNVTFKTKNEIAIELIRELSSNRLMRAKWVGADSAFGSDYDFLDAIPEQYWYFADVKKNQQVFLSAGTHTPEYSGKGRRDLKEVADFKPVKVEEISDDPKIPWVTVFLGEGSKGPIIAREKCLRVYESRNKLPGREIWIYIRELGNGGVKHSISNAPADIPVETLRTQALRRWPIEQCFEECKRDLGMDHYEGRSWCGWHRHKLLVFIGHLFLLTIRKSYLHPDPTDDGGTEDGLCGNDENEMYSDDASSLTYDCANDVRTAQNPQTEMEQLLNIVAQVDKRPSVAGKPILTLPQARDIVAAYLDGVTDVIIKTLERIRYWIKKAVSAQNSHRKAKIEVLKRRVKELDRAAA